MSDTALERAHDQVAAVYTAGGWALIGFAWGVLLLLVDLGYGRVEVKPGPVALTIAAALVWLLLKVVVRSLRRKYRVRIESTDPPEPGLTARVSTAWIAGGLLMVGGGLGHMPVVTTLGLIPVATITVLLTIGTIILAGGWKPWPFRVVSTHECGPGCAGHPGHDDDLIDS